MKKRRNLFITLLVTVAMLFSMAGSCSAAATRKLGDYFYVSVAMQGSAGMMRTQPREKEIGIGIGGEIEDWGQAVFAGSDIGASLSRRSSHSYSAPSGLQVQWEFYDRNNRRIGTDEGWDTVALGTCAGGHLVVTVSLEAPAGDWAKSSVRSYVTIS